MIRLVKKRESPKYAGLKAALIAAAISFFTGCVIFGCLGINPLNAYGVMFEGVFGSFHSFSEVLVKATPITFTGLAVAVAAMMMLWNIGAEGQLVWGGIFAAGTALYIFPGAPAALVIPAIIAASALGGMFWALIPAALKARYNVNEILTTLLLNYVAIIYMEHLFYGPWRDPAGFGFPGTAQIPEAAHLIRFLGTRIHLGFPLALLSAVFLFFLLNKSNWGYKIRVIGNEQRAARYAGFNVTGKTLSVLALSGALAGIAGMAEVCGIHYRLQTGLAVGYGYDGIIVAWLAGLNPLLVPLTAALLGALFVGGEQLQTVLGLPSTISLILEAALLFGLFAGQAIIQYRIVLSGGSSGIVEPGPVHKGES
jgi:general nucleoside transport system permease protein